MSRRVDTVSTWTDAPGDTSVTLAPPGVKPLAKSAGIRPLLEVALTWGVIALAIGAYLRYPTPWIFAGAFVLVASRQYALLILMHDAFHSLIHSNRLVNDFVGAILVGAPCGSAYWQAKAMHLKHHRRLGGLDDPEFFLHCAGAPRDKRTLLRLVGHFILLICGGQVLYTHFGEGEGVRPMRQLSRAVPRIFRVATAQLVLLTVFTLVGSWSMYFTLWLMPLTTLAVIFNGVRAFCDHANISDGESEYGQRLVTYISNPVERFFFAPFHMNFHAEHHLFPYVPHYRLPRLRQIVMESADHRALVQWRQGYLGFVRHFLRAQPRLSG